jgi:hypothetical protein
MSDTYEMPPVDLAIPAFEVGPGFTCRELDALVHLLVLTGQIEAALAWVESHTRSDDFEDAHCRRDPQKYLDRLVGKEIEGSIFDHTARPCDDPSPCNCCKDCGEDVTWMGGPGGNEWAHSEES